MAIYIALGSNLGDKENNLKEALRRLTKKGITVCRVSGFIATEPYGVADQPDFLNAVAEIETDKSPAELLQILLQTEREMGRKRIRRWGERNIDLDLLLYDDRIIDLPDTGCNASGIKENGWTIVKGTAGRIKIIGDVTGKER